MQVIQCSKELLRHCSVLLASLLLHFFCFPKRMCCSLKSKLRENLATLYNPAKKIDMTLFRPGLRRTREVIQSRGEGSSHQLLFGITSPTPAKTTKFFTTL